MIPMALELLQVDPFTEGDYYGGDLLAAVLRVEAAYWRRYPDLRREAAEVAARALGLLPTLAEIDRQTAREVLSEACDVFKKSATEVG